MQAHLVSTSTYRMNGLIWPVMCLRARVSFMHLCSVNLIAQLCTAQLQYYIFINLHGCHVSRGCLPWAE
jgi:hypothetical protein